MDSGQVRHWCWVSLLFFHRVFINLGRGRRNVDWGPKFLKFITVHSSSAMFLKFSSFPEWCVTPKTIELSSMHIIVLQKVNKLIKILGYCKLWKERFVLLKLSKDNQIGNIFNLLIILFLFSFKFRMSIHWSISLN